MNLGRRHAVLVELLDGRLQHVLLAGRRRRVRGRAAVGHELDALDHAAVPDLEHLDGRAGGSDLQAERVAVAELGAGHLLLARPERVDRADRISQLRGLLEPLGRRGIAHPVAEGRDELVVAALEKQLRVLDGDAVILGRTDLAHARRDAALDVELETRPPALAGDDLVARPDAEQPVRQRHRAPPERRRQEGSGVVVVVPLHAPGDEHARERLAGRQLQIGIVLVVAQQDVVARGALLDQVVLERQRFHDRVGDDDFEAVRLVEQRVDARAGAVGAEVAADAVAQHSRLADVERFAGVVEVDVDAGLLRQAGDLGLEITDWHAIHCAFWARVP